MKTIVDILLLTAALCSVFFTASLANVPRRVRLAVAAIGPSFLLTFLLHWKFPLHVDYGLAAVSISLVASVGLGFQYMTTAPLTRDLRLYLLKRFAMLFGIAAVTVSIVTTVIVKTAEAKTRAPALSPPTHITPADTTRQAIDQFNKLSQP